MLSKVLEGIKKYAEPVLGRIKAAEWFGKTITAANEEEEVTVLPEPLGTQLGYEMVTIDHEAVVQTAISAFKKSADYKAVKQELGVEEGKDVDMLTCPWQYMVDPLLSAYRAAAVNQHGWKPADAMRLITEETCFGKGHIGWILTSDSVPLDLCGKNWRMSDWLRPPTRPLGDGGPIDLRSLNLTDSKLGQDKELLGDGVVGVLRPETLGLPDGTSDFFQVRCEVRDGGTIKLLYKGLLVVHPQADNTWAYPDGYGYDLLADPNAQVELRVHSMLEGSKFLPKSRYTLQGCSAHGVEGWEAKFFGLENLKLAASSSDVLLEDRMVRADVPIKALGGWGLLRALARLLKMTVHSGQARIVLPADVFQHIAGYEHVFPALSRTYTSKVTGVEVHGFFAPAHLKRYFDAAGGVGSEWVLNRRPDLPTGVCVQRHVLLGYVEGFNAFVINGDSMKLSGNDFDGDMNCVFPTPERGGLYMPFNDLPVEEQAHRLEIAGGSRKDREKKDFENGLCRHAGQLASAGILGPADITARKFKDCGDLDAAYAMEPWIQAAVDLQKRDMALPHALGAAMMPKVSMPEGHVTMTQVLRALQKGEPASWKDLTPGEKGEFRHQWAFFEYKLEQLYLMSKLGMKESPIHVHANNSLAVQVVSRFGYELGTRMSQAISELDVYNISKKPLMHKFDYPDREATPLSEAPEHLKKMAATVVTFDGFLTEIQEASKVSKPVKQGYYNLKDGLLDAAREFEVMGELSKYASTYRVFQMFAGEEEFAEYFASDTTSKRISDLFCVLTARDFERVEGRKVPTFTNNKDVMVGLFRFQPRTVTLERIKNGFRVRAKHSDFPSTVRYVTKAHTVQDALLDLRSRCVNVLIAGGTIMAPQQVELHKHIMAVRDSNAPVGSPEHMAGFDSPEQALLAQFVDDNMPVVQADELGLSPEELLLQQFGGAPAQPAPVQAHQPLGEEEAKLLASMEREVWGKGVRQATVLAAHDAVSEGTAEAKLLAAFSV